MYRQGDNGIEVFLAHPGGPFWAKKDLGVWSIPKGEFADDEEPLAAARREFREETGSDVEGNFFPLEPIKQSGGKWVYAWAVEGDCEERKVQSNTFTMEWPPGSGRQKEFPEIDRARWFTLRDAKRRILKSQQELLEQLQKKLDNDMA